MIRNLGLPSGVGEAEEGSGVVVPPFFLDYTANYRLERFRKSKIY